MDKSPNWPINYRIHLGGVRSLSFRNARRVIPREHLRVSNTDICGNARWSGVGSMIAFWRHCGVFARQPADGRMANPDPLRVYQP